MSKKCSSCKFESSSTVKFCGNCGSQSFEGVSDPTKCQCAKQSTSKFCPECGKPSRSVDAVAPLSPRKPSYQPIDHNAMSIPQNKIEVRPGEKAKPAYQPIDHNSMSIPQNKIEVRPGEKAKPAYQPIDHNSMNIPQNKIEVTATEKPKGLPKYIPPNHASVVPVVKEVADGCYDGQYKTKIDVSEGKTYLDSQ